ncbi:oxidoreductase [Loa loa]|uniref:Oxidoreductase n=1 Tax=Loa loa TaxID=7209 RepID=A0A1I7W5C7_LOALO|nr:oxidoreductase [Loa loa]EFO16322.1 oxidoreductase [Loa loa]
MFMRDTQRLLGSTIANKNFLSDIHGWEKRMSTWVTKQFDSDMERVEMSIPIIEKPDELLLKVKTASVNLIDTVMRKGYGRQLCSAVKNFRNCSVDPTTLLPFIGGRDCSGIVEETGRNVKRFKKGDEVIAVVDPFSSGTHAEFVVVNESNCVSKPTNISYIDGAAFPYTACTAWSALVSVARINSNNAASQRVLIHGGAGGVGTTAVQMLKAWNINKVVVTCSNDCFDMMQRLGAIPIDYKSREALEKLISEGPFDVVLDCAQSELTEWSSKVMGLWRNSVHVSLLSPLLSDTDRYGIPFGIASTAVKYFLRATLPAIRRGQWYSYAFFAPHPECMQQISEFLKDGKMKPVIDQIFKYDELPMAYDKVLKKRGRGKTIINMSES